MLAVPGSVTMSWWVRTDGPVSRRAMRTSALGLGVALVGGGAALAAPGLLPEGGTDDQVTFLAATAADEEQRDTLADHCATEVGSGDPFCSGPSDQDPPGDDDGDGDQGDGGDQDGEGDTNDGDAGGEDEAGGTGPGTSERVHRALTGGDELRPGDPGFGQAVAARACSGQLGSLVSRAARGEVLSDEDLVLPPCEPRGRRTTGDDAEGAPTDDGTEEGGPGDTEVGEANDGAPGAATAGKAAGARGGGEGRGRPDRDAEARPSRGGPPSHAGGSARGGAQGADRGAGRGRG